MGQSDYARLRELSGLFVRTSAHGRGRGASRWSCTFAFDPEPPRGKRTTTLERLALHRARNNAGGAS